MTDISKNDDLELEERVLIRKLDWHLLPIFSILYLLSYLNGTNIGNAKLTGLEQDVHLTSEQYQWCLSIFFLGYFFFQIPSNIILRRWRPSNWISLIVLLWGTTAVCMAAVYSFATLLLARFLLGTFQCGYFPGFIYYISLWYRRKEQAIRLGCFWSCSALAGAFSGLLAYAITLIKSSNLSQWQLIFIIEGIPTVIFAFICWFYLPDSPEQARFLTNKQRQLQLDRLIQDTGISQDHSFSWSQVLSVFTDWKTYAYATIYICGTIVLQGITLLLPTLIHDMGEWAHMETQLMTIPPYMTAFITILVVSRSSDYFVERSFHLVFTNLLAIIGLTILIFVDRQHAYLHYIGVILVTSGVYSHVSVKVAWINNNFSSLTRRAVALAFIVSVGSIGGLISGQIYDEKQKPQYLTGHTIALACTIIQAILTISLRIIFMFINYRRARLNDAEIEDQIEYYGGNELVGDHHPEFRYTL
ncbi:hypothetical protein I4U23_007100 [Adineta vaga]|nr:hypothetical protein I4U23_007100 [Adineta vaga]